MSLFGKRLGLHVIEFPSGRWGYVGSIPTVLGEAVPASKAAILGCRSWRCPETGCSMEWKFPSFDTRAEAVAFAERRGVFPAKENT